jgi:predicted phosphodiesterase
MTEAQAEDPQAAEYSPPLLMIHLSDIHFGQEEGGRKVVNDDARDQLINQVKLIAAERAVNKQPPLNSIVVTGDIAYSGKQDEYETAAAWLDKLADAAGMSELSVQLVPGNHDVDRDQMDYAGRLVIDEIRKKGQPALDEVLESEEAREILYRRFAAYQPFASGYGCSLATDGGRAGTKQYKLGPRQTVRVVGFNSAILCHDKDQKDPPTLLLGQKQHVIREEEGIEWIVLMHHPLDWLKDGGEARKFILNRARILMCGHEHKPACSVEEVEDNGKVLLLDAGATTPKVPTEEYTYTFNVIEIALAETGSDLDVKIESFVWDQGKTRFQKDAARYDGSHCLEQRLPCPNFVEGGRPAIGGKVKPVETAEEAANALAGEAIEPLTVSAEPDEAAKYARLRRSFFQQLPLTSRLDVLVALKVIPPNLIQYPTTNIMVMALENMRKEGRLDDLERAMGDRLRADKGESP